MRIFYPLLRFFSAANKAQAKAGNVKSLESFYSLRATLINGHPFSFEELKGKKIVLVNTASDCGYTPQYGSLQKLADKYPNLRVLAFPSNDFKNQETGTDEEIAEFCKINYGLTIPVFSKSVVRKTENQSTVFAWLTKSALNGWNNDEPSWNFNKYLVNQEGELVSVFSHTVDPLSKKIKDAIES